SRAGFPVAWGVGDGSGALVVPVLEIQESS
ncbi:unnamed protein product, partial [marine sediment metagenome]